MTMSLASRPIVVEARPFPISLDPRETAVLVVDMQNDFGTEGGMFHRAGIDISPIRAVVNPITSVLAAARAEGMKIVFLKMGFRPDLSDAGPVGSPNRDRHAFLGVGETVPAPDGGSSRVLIRDQWGTAIISGLAPEPGDLQIYKHRFSGFFESELDELLKQAGIRNLLVTGCTTSVCVESTVRDAMFRDYSCIVLADCCAEPIGHDLSRSNHEASLLVIETLFGWVANSATILEALAVAGRR